MRNREVCFRGSALGFGLGTPPGKAGIKSPGNAGIKSPGKLGIKSPGKAGIKPPAVWDFIPGGLG
jgi:hypothetical protein